MSQLLWGIPLNPKCNNGLQTTIHPLNPSLPEDRRRHHLRARYHSPQRGGEAPRVPHTVRTGAGGQGRGDGTRGAGCAQDGTAERHRLTERRQEVEDGADLDAFVAVSVKAAFYDHDFGIVVLNLQ